VHAGTLEHVLQVIADGWGVMDSSRAMAATR
jgi:hypothetical protein